MSVCQECASAEANQKFLKGVEETKKNDWEIFKYGRRIREHSFFRREGRPEEFP